MIDEETTGMCKLSVTSVAKKIRVDSTASRRRLAAEEEILLVLDDIIGNGFNQMNEATGFVC